MQEEPASPKASFGSTYACEAVETGKNPCTEASQEVLQKFWTPAVIVPLPDRLKEVAASLRAVPGNAGEARYRPATAKNDGAISAQRDFTDVAPLADALQQGGMPSGTAAAKGTSTISDQGDFTIIHGPTGRADRTLATDPESRVTSIGKRIRSSIPIATASAWHTGMGLVFIAVLACLSYTASVLRRRAAGAGTSQALPTQSHTVGTGDYEDRPMIVSDDIRIPSLMEAESTLDRPGG
jgi:hypothetical protein